MPQGSRFRPETMFVLYKVEPNNNPLIRQGITETQSV